jgi:hypothetical protein
VTDPRRSRLITTIAGRPAALAACLASLAEQTRRDFEVVLVDQSSSAEVEALAARYPWVRYIAAAPIGLSASRNVAAAAARGALVAFPDDDATWAPDFVERAIAHFDADPALGVVSGRALDPTTQAPLNRFPRERSRITVWNALPRHISFTLVVARRFLPDPEPMFDAQLGVGTSSPFGGSEETEMLFRVLLRGAGGVYDPALVAYHAAAPVAGIPRRKIDAYAMGWGACFRKMVRQFGWWPAGPIFLGTLVRPFGGALLDVARGRMATAGQHLAIGRGRVRGWRRYGAYVAEAATASHTAARAASQV